MMENFPDLMRQKYAGSVHFLTERGEHFASIHLTPNHDDSRDDLRKLTYQDALDWIKQSFTLEMSRELSQEEEGKFTWVLMPHTGILFTRAKRDKSFPTEVLDPFCMELPIIRGRYYIAMHRVGCDTGLDVDGSYTRGSDHWMKECCIRVRGANPKRLHDYRPAVAVRPATMDVAEDDSWEGNVTALFPFHGMIPSDVINAETSMKLFYNPRLQLEGVCAITGLGGLENGKRTGSLVMSHILPAQHYSIYPISGATEEPSCQPDRDDYSPADKWDMTWDARFNSISLCSHLYPLWNARFVAIQPETHIIRVFSPHPGLDEFNGMKAHFPDGKAPDNEALRWHYRMCVWDHMMHRIALQNCIRGITGKYLDIASVLPREEPSDTTKAESSSKEIAEVESDEVEPDQRMTAPPGPDDGSDSDVWMASGSSNPISESRKRKRVQWWNRGESGAKKARTGDVMESVEAAI